MLLKARERQTLTQACIVFSVVSSMSTALIGVVLIVAALGTCGVLSWRLYESRQAEAVNRLRYEQHLAQLRVAVEASEATLNVLKEVFEAPTGVAARVGAQRELASAMRTYAPHLPKRYRHSLTTLQANERFFLSIYRSAPDMFSESAKARLERHTPIGDDFFEADRTDLIAEAGVLLLRAKDVLESARSTDGSGDGAKLMGLAVEQGLQIGVKRSQKLAEIFEAWSVQLDTDT